MESKLAKIMTTREFGEYFGLTPQTVAKYCNSKEWRRHRFAKKVGGRWLINRERVIEFLTYPKETT